MKTRLPTPCSACYRTIAAGTLVGLSRAMRLRHLGSCPPISTEELLAGRARYEAEKALRAARKSDDGASYARHDAANVAVYGERGPGR